MTKRRYLEIASTALLILFFVAGLAISFQKPWEVEAKKALVLCYVDMMALFLGIALLWFSMEYWQKLPVLSCCALIFSVVLLVVAVMYAGFFIIPILAAGVIYGFLAEVYYEISELFRILRGKKRKKRKVKKHD